MRVHSIFLVSLLAVSGCGESPSADAGVDAGMGEGDAGFDAGRDAGPRPDSCRASQEEAVSTVGCNGPVLGDDVPDNEFGGRCTKVEGDDAGTCTGTDAYCFGADGERGGICLQTCTPGSTYVSRGDCPSGSRCFDYLEGLCFPDCEGAADCTSHACDGEGSCVGPDCLSNADCASPTPLCIEDQCVACTSDAQCSVEAGGTICNAGVCVECTEDSQCGTEFCVDNVCVACATDAQCGTEFCDVGDPTDPNDNGCFPCVTDAHCTTGATPYCADHACVSCTTTPSVCTGATPVCATAGTAIGTCVECENGATDCSGATPICDATSNTCRACGETADCVTRDPAQPICITDTADTRIGQCLECLSSADCGVAEPICAAGSCRACASSTECEARNEATPICVTDTADPLAGQCTAAGCLPATMACDTGNDLCCAGLTCQADVGGGFTCQAPPACLTTGMQCSPAADLCCTGLSCQTDTEGRDSCQPIP
jgi:hypothetical protein